jgi:hypothetical protein
MPTEYYVAKLAGGSVHIYRSNGTYVRSLVAGAAFAVVQGDEIHVTMPGGHIRSCGVNGILKRSI